MNNPIENENTLRYLRKQHKDWSEDKIIAEAKKIWDKYVKDNKLKLEDDAIKRQKPLTIFLPSQARLAAMRGVFCANISVQNRLKCSPHECAKTTRNLPAAQATHPRAHHRIALQQPL